MINDHIQRVVDAYRNFNNIGGFDQITDNDEIREKGSSLSIPLYVRPNNGNHNGKIAESRATYGDKSLEETIDERQQRSMDLRK
ncbi:hypothetical protein ACFL0M_03760 [Thermodesulfobacteriota bacterium]